MHLNDTVITVVVMLVLNAYLSFRFYLLGKEEGRSEYVLRDKFINDRYEREKQELDRRRRT